MAIPKTANPTENQIKTVNSKFTQISRLYWLLPLLVFTLAASIYFITSASGLTWKNGGEDGGDLAVAAKLLGIAHPTGYPLYLLLSQPLLWLGLEPIRALNLLSGFMGALAAASLCLAVTQLLQLSFEQDSVLTEPNRVAKTNPKTADFKVTAKQSRTNICSWAGGTAAGLILAFSPLFWSQAVVAEVYSMNAAWLALVLWSLVRWFKKRQKTLTNSTYNLGLVLLLAGLAIAHHRTGLLTLVAGIAFVFSSLAGWSNSLAFIKTLKLRQWLGGLGSLGLGFSPYLYILFRGGEAPAANWLNPSWDNLGGFWDEFNASFYHDLLFAAPATQSFGRISAIAQLLLAQFGIWGVALGLTGWWATLNLPMLKPFFWFALVGFVLHCAFATIYAADNSQVYLIPAFLIWAALLGVGLAYLLAQLWQFKVANQRRAAMAISSVIVLSALQLSLNYSSVDASQDKTAENWVSQILRQAPQGAVLLTNQDKFSFGLWYKQYALAQRNDLILVETRLLTRDWYQANLHRLYPTLNLSGQNAGRDLDQQLDLLTKANPSLAFYNANSNGLQAISK